MDPAWASVIVAIGGGCASALFWVGSIAARYKRSEHWIEEHTKECGVRMANEARSTEILARVVKSLDSIEARLQKVEINCARHMTRQILNIPSKDEDEA